MKNVKILTLNNHDEWDILVNNCQKPDIHFTTQYMKNFKEIIGGIPMLFVLFDNDSDNYILYPFFKRRINDLPEFSQLEDEYYDIISPWYFGGKLISSEENCVELSRVFDKNFKSFMDKERIVSEFTRIHPLIDSNNEYAKSNNGKYNYDISYVDLTESIEAIWGNFNKANKNAINSAIRKKINIKFSNSNKSLKNFFELYNLTMKRINVDAFYYFPLSFFEELSKNLENNFVIVTAEYEKKPIASTIFLYKYGFVHYWLSGSNYDFRNLYPNNLLIFESIKFFKKLGNHTFILMGGSNENLRRFKESFTKKRVEFYTISRVFNNEVFTYLNKKRKFQGNEFFPPYREVIKKRQ